MTFSLPQVAGFVSLVGAGPGDPDLLTRRGQRRHEEADAVVYDRLISPELLDCCRRDADRYDVGKLPGSCRSARQEDINDLLVQLGKLGRRVVRLKGGDPFLFGRGGEEALALAAAGIRFEVVPGVSSALAAPAAAGIPVTHRGVATSVTIATGHGENGTPDHDWESLARMRGTLVFMMAVERMDQIVGRLIAHGRSRDEPAAVVRWGTTPWQTVVQSSLDTIVETVRSEVVTSPAVLVIGNTVALADQLNQVSSLVEHAEMVAF